MNFIFSGFRTDSGPMDPRVEHDRRGHARRVNIEHLQGVVTTFVIQPGVLEVRQCCVWSPHPTPTVMSVEFIMKLCKQCFEKAIHRSWMSLDIKDLKGRKKNKPSSSYSVRVAMRINRRSVYMTVRNNESSKICAVRFNDRRLLTDRRQIFVLQMLNAEC